jgi:hypothetical protein
MQPSKLTAMKNNQIPSFVRKFVLGGLLVWSFSTQAQFSYTNGDMCIGLRSSAGVNDVVIDVGAVTTFTTLPVGNKITISALTGAVLNDAFSDTNNLMWSAFAFHDPSFSDPYTLFMTKARTVYGTQSTAWLNKSTGSQGQTGGYVVQVGTGATTTANDGSYPAGPYNTPSLFVDPESDTTSYKNLLFYLGTQINWHGTFQGNPEQSTPANFTTGGQPVRADLYQLNAGAGGSSTYLGYFEMNTNGVLTYTSGPSSATLAQPQVVNITRSGNTNTVYFTTSGAYSYSLLASSTLTAAVSTWSQVGTSITGNGLTNSIQEINAASPRFYAIKAQ